MEISTAKLAVGDARQADRFLEGDDLADRVVLRDLEAGLVELAGLAGAGCLDEPRRADETADVLGMDGHGI